MQTEKVAISVGGDNLLFLNNQNFGAFTFSESTCYQLGKSAFLNH